VLLCGGFAAGTLYGPRVLTMFHSQTAQAAAPPPADKEDPPAAATAVLDPIVVDLRESTGDLHHLKVGIAIELKKSMHGEEFKPYEPRARDAAIAYLRSLKFDEVTSPDQFDRIRSTLRDRIAAAVGRDNVKRILFTDFVAQ